VKEKIYKVKLKKIKSNHKNLRTEEVEGQTLTLPEVGKAFVLVGEALNPEADYRSVYTTEIKHVEKMGESYRFNTQNSIYHLDVLGEVE